jgi:hypothetical protein
MCTTNGDAPNTPPWMVAFARYLPGPTVEMVECGGTLIHPHWVLTCAHAAIDPLTTTALIGPRTIRECPPTQMSAIAGVTRFPAYDGTGKRPLHDLALVKLECPWSGPFVRLKPPPVVPRAAGGYLLYVTQAEALGWGDADALATTFSNKLKRVRLNVQVESSGLMTGDGSPGATSCYGDSGGPLLIRDGEEIVQTGITSSMSVERKCSDGSVYTGLTQPYLDWIQVVIGEKVGDERRISSCETSAAS